MQGYVSIKDIARLCNVTPRRAARLLASHLQVSIKAIAKGVPSAFAPKAVAIIRQAAGK